MAGLIAMKNGDADRPRPSTDFRQSLKRWLAMLGETFQRNSSLSLLQIKSYEVALCDLSVSQLDAACEKALRTWTFVAMPPPGFIRKCLPSEEVEEFSGLPQLTYTDAATEEERIAALESPDYLKLKAKLGVVTNERRSPAKSRATTDHLVIADRNRLELLDQQKRELTAKYGGER